MINPAESPSRGGECAATLLGTGGRHVGAGVAGAQLRLLLGEDSVEGAADADAKGRFQEQKAQAQAAEQQGEGFVEAEEAHQEAGGEGHAESEHPCQLLLVGADPFRALAAHHQCAEEHTRRQAGTDEQAQHHVDHEEKGEGLKRCEIVGQGRDHEGHNPGEEEQSGGGPHGAFVEDGDVDAVDQLAECGLFRGRGV